ncbi:glycosyltransferase family 4 protein [Cereibacter changlensis]|uniref:Glycosyltransferase family 4 protein n=1 Tax=Cereibacter changlensis TaxID=402884 RepID=A0A4U0YZU0_9RHOB|nr:glycosyltransferase [Cereibacter changlensis]TKA97378.1 glycosyltransferase family 4 protein [Cereibacter changlensis]
MNRHVVVLAPSSPPSGGSHATRITALIEALKRSGWRVTLVTGAWSDERRAASVQFRTVQSLSRVIEARGGFFRSAAVRVGSLGKSPGSRQRMVQAVRAFVRARAFPDTYASWIPYATRASLREIREGGADLIISSGAPFSSHIAGYLVSRLSGVPLALDYGDPWVYEPGRPRRGLRLWIEHHLEAAILNWSKVVSVTTQATIDLYKAKFPKLQVPFVLSPMGFDREDFLRPLAKSVPDRVVLNFAYTGRINEEYRSVDDFVHLLNCVGGGSPAFCFHFYGSEFGGVRDSMAAFEENGIVRFHDSVDHQEYIQVLRQSDGLVLFGNNNYVQVPGKVADYLAARKNILYFTNVKDPQLDPALRSITEVQNDGVFLGSSRGGFHEYVSACVSGPPAQDNDKLEHLSWERCFVPFLAAVSDVMRQSGAVPKDVRDDGASAARW